MKYLIVLFFFFLFGSSLECRSGNIETIISFGDSLYLNKNYSDALHEYQRAFFFAGNELKSPLGKKIADCYLILEDFKKARNFYDSAIYYSRLDSSRLNFEFQKILSFILENNFGYALILTNNLEVGFDSLVQRRKEFYQGICYVGMRQYNDSYNHFMNLVPLKDTLKRLRIQQVFENQKKLNRPNTNLAIVLSIIVPGAGQAYSGDFMDGLNSFLLLGSLYFLGSLVSKSSFIILIPFMYRYYLGGIHNAKVASEKRKKEKQHIFYTNLMEVFLK
jgi:hypothetical protein